MRLTDLIRNHHPELREKLDSRQYALAEKLISFKLHLNSNQKDMAKRAGVDFETYIQMENAELSIPVQDYETALLAIEKNEEKRGVGKHE